MNNPANAAAAKANRSIYNALAPEFDLEHLRHNASLALTYQATREMDVDFQFLSSLRSGEQPWGASFAFNNAIELPQPLDQRTNDLSLGASWANPRTSVRLGWAGSWFTNDIHSLTWDNPIRLTDFSNGLAPPAGPYDPSAYSNGNGPAFGRQAMAPSNVMNVVSGIGLGWFSAASRGISGRLPRKNISLFREAIPIIHAPKEPLPRNERMPSSAAAICSARSRWRSTTP